MPISHFYPRPFKPLLASVLLGALALATPALAQSANSLEAQRQAVFAQLLTTPADRALMTQYARLSVRLRDFEAAAATLERFVDLEPRNSAARLELAQAYLALGAYDLAEYHFAAVAASGAPGLSARAQALQAAAQDQGAPNRLSGRVALGVGWTDTSDDSGLVGTVALSWRIDLGGANAQDWVTDFGATAFAPGDGATSDRQVLRLRSGPEFRLTAESFGPILQPYLQFTATRDGDGDDLNELLLGVAYQNPHSALWTSFADLAIGRAEDTTTGAEIDVTDISLGATLRPNSATRARLTLLRRTEGGPVEDSTRIGARLDMTYRFDTGLGRSDRDWVLGAHLLADRTGITGGLNPRDEDRIGYGLSLQAFVTDNAYIEARAARVDRDATLTAFDADETVFSLQFGWEF